MKKRIYIITLLTFIIIFLSLSPAMASYYDTVNHWAEKDITWATERGYLKGDGDGYFRPQDNVTKAEYVTGVNRLINSTAKAKINFADVKTQSWYYDDLAKGVYNEIIDNSYSNFNPDQAITRDEAARIVARAYKLAPYIDGSAVFKDYNKITYKGEVGALVSKKALNGWDDGNYHPDKNLTRAEYSKILRASVENLGLPNAPAQPSTECCNEELKALQQTIEEAERFVNDIHHGYSQESLNPVKEAIKNGKDILNKYKDFKCTDTNVCPHRTEINNAKVKIEQARTNIKENKQVPCCDLEDLQTKLYEFEHFMYYDSDKYTPETINNYVTAEVRAREVYNRLKDVKKVQGTTCPHIHEIQEAIDDLVKAHSLLKPISSVKKYKITIEGGKAYRGGSDRITEAAPGELVNISSTSENWAPLHEFDMWLTNPSEILRYKSVDPYNEFIMPAQDVTIIVEYKPLAPQPNTYSIHVAGGFAVYNEMVVTEGEPDKLINLLLEDIQTPPGKTFLRWSSKPNGWIYNENAKYTEFYMPYEDIYIEAIYE